MFKALFIFFLLTPVLYEGRYRPLETVPQEASYIRLEAENYASLAGTTYLEAAGKALKYPTVWQLKAELLLFYTPFKWLILASYLLALLFWKKRAMLIFLVTGFFLHTTVLALRCFILSRPPVSNMAETLLYVPWIAMIIGFIFYQRKSILFSSVLSASILLLFLPSRANLDNVQAVLDSQYWLIVHVLMVVGSYGVFCVAGVCGHIFLIQKNPSKLLEKTLIQIMYLGTGLLICGTILGGVWAAQSWGRFWDWDPKESWAFISSSLYLIWIHAYRFKKIDGKALAVGAVLGLLTITFTWYGVNYILGTGLHSYGFGNGGEWMYYAYVILECVFLGCIYFKNKVYKKS